MRKRIWSFALVFALILSLSAVAYAADSPYSYTVTKTGTYTVSETISEASAVHTCGTEDSISYSINKIYYFDTNQFDSAYRVGLEGAYKSAGFKTSLPVYQSGIKTVAATEPSGVYSVVAVITYAKGTWNVKYESSIIRNGSFTASPVSYSIQLVR